MNREARVGLVFLIGVAAALWLTVATGDVSQGTGAYAVNFPAVGSLDVGASVRYNGVPVGRVRAIDLMGTVDNAPNVAVRFDIEPRFLDGLVVSDATIFRIDEGMLGGSTLVIEHEGPGQPIDASALTGMTGEKPANFNEAVREITALVQENRGNLRTAIAALPGAVTNFSGMAGEIRDVVAENRENVSSTLQNVAAAGASITAAVEENRANLQAAIADIGGVFQEGRAALRGIWPRVQETADILLGTFQRIEGAAGQIEDAVAENRAYLRATMESLAAAAPSIKRTSDNLATITDQVASGEGTLGSLVMDDSLAKKAEVAVDSVTARAEEVKPFTSGFSALRFYIGIDAGTDFNTGAGKASAYLRIEPRPWKFYQGGFTYRTAPSDRDTVADDPDSLDVDWDLTLGWRFFPNDDRELYHLTVEGGFVEGKLGGRIWVPIGSQDWQWVTTLRTKHSGFEENTRRYEEGDFMVRSLVRWNAWRGISISAGINDAVEEPGFYGGITAELLDDDIRNLLTVFRLTP